MTDVGKTPPARLDAYLELRKDGELTYLVVPADQVTLGSSPSAGIPLVNASELSLEHLLIAPRRDGCWISVAEGVEFPVEFEQRPISAELVPWDSQVTVGALQFTLKRGRPPAPSLFENDSSAKEGGKKSKALWQLAQVLLVLAAFFAYRQLRAQDDFLQDEPPPPPPLFGNLSLACPEGDPKTLAETFAYEALARMDRYPFDSEEGTLSVFAHTRAIACYEKLGDREAAGREEQIRASLMDKLTQDFRGKTVLVRRAGKKQEFRRALQLSRDLIVMVRHKRNSEYLRWLAQVERYCIAKIREEEEAEKNKIFGNGFKIFG